MTNQSRMVAGAHAATSSLIGAPEQAAKTTEVRPAAQEAHKVAGLDQLAASELAAICSQPTITVMNPNATTTTTITSTTTTTTTTSDHHNAQVAANSPEQSTSANQWLAAAHQTRQGIGQRMSQASDQLSHSIRQLYASASSITDVPPSYHNIPGIVPYYHGRSIGPPPSYDDVINPYAPPPTYQSLFGQMREARKSSRGLVDLLRRLLIILVSTLGCTLLIAFMILIPFTMIIVGAIYIDECHIEHIPAFLLVGGLVWASKNIIHCYGQCKQQEQQESSNPLGDLYTQSGHLQTLASNTQDTLATTTTTAAAPEQQPGTVVSINGQRLKSSICESLLNCVLFGWFIAGCVIVFRNYEPDFENSASVRYCHRTVYMYTFWLITSALISFGLFIGCICCLMVSSAVASRQDDIDLA